MSEISLRINGQPEVFAPPLTVADLLVAKGLAGKRLAVERNGDIVPRGQHAVTELCDGDRLEIVVAVGGG
ncbi:sulfur carrier protein ThiS [Nitrogeniibacter mangrovi]|uniref:Sulfur carrier protein ThiS n=1 Tax=Nitrogeniibacter mangrovi TaxID=2016596 RepID=A0A6C1B2K1_9RHOO|nr:sulfur carrier protein ThiS [Nitrogeniibacter mangrovi]QID16434.1 sulfur carrier protein ThiS [Nitrogeniibacter mangrovi]